MTQRSDSHHHAGASGPDFSVIVPAYNAENTLPETLDSIRAQEYPSWECIVVDDGSTDSTARIVSTYRERDSRFVLISQQNTGCPGAYQTGVNAASADLIVICAADDLLLPAHLGTMHDLIARNPGFDIYSSNGRFLYDETGEERTVYTSAEWQQERSLTFEQVVEECFFSVGTTYRKHIIEAIGGYRLGVYVDDYDVWLRAMARGYKHLYTPAVLSVHRISSFQQTANLDRVYESNAEVYENLLANSGLTPDQERVIRSRMADSDRRAEEHRTSLVLEAQSKELKRRVERVLGARLSGPALTAIHAVSWIVRPLREFLARVRGR